jgi:hypothetical protein
MKRRAPVKSTASTDKTVRLSHLNKMTPKAKGGVASDVSSDQGAPVAQVEGQRDFHQVYRPHGSGYGCSSDIEPDSTTGMMRLKKSY